MGRSLEYRVLSEDAGMTLEKILFQRLGLTVRQIRRSKFRDDGICVNGQRSRVSTVLNAGDLVTVQIGDVPKREETCTGCREEADLSRIEQPEILYEVIEGKPVGTRFIGRRQKWSAIVSWCSISPITNCSSIFISTYAIIIIPCISHII